MSPIILDHTSAEPKYQQVMNSIIKAIDNNELKVGDKLASVNEVSESTGIAKKTVVQAFEQLKKAGIIHSVQYKGYFVASRNTQSKHNIFVLFNNLSAYKEEIYECIKDSLGHQGVVDIFFHHDNTIVFDTLIEKSAGRYTEYVVMPIKDQEIEKSLQLLPRDKVYILDLGYADFGQQYPSVCQYFEEDIYDALKQGLPKMKKYQKLILVMGSVSKYNTVYTEKGFMRFCKEFGFRNESIEHIKDRKPQKGELYIVVDDADLVKLVKLTIESSLKLGKDIGIISYNEIPFKEIVANGIATISTDFGQMGKNIIDMIINKRKDHVRNPCRLIDRKSF
jgi:DNA-binding transcriptional regulator YhcF (GntR family)